MCCLILGPPKPLGLYVVITLGGYNGGHNKNNQKEMSGHHAPARIKIKIVLLPVKICISSNY